MAFKIHFDTSGNPELPTFILAHKDGRIIGELSNIDKVKVNGSLREPYEITLLLYKQNNGIITPFWNEILDFRLVFCKEWNTWFEITVKKEQSDATTKGLTLIRLGEAELSQLNIYETEINTEDDIAREDYTEPTILYNPNNPDASLLHRLLKDKAPHYSIRHVDNSVKDIQRTFSFNDKSLKECFDEIAEELDLLFVYDSDSDADKITINRVISVYDMLATCKDCGHRGDFTSTCPECNSTNIYEGYGEDTTICVDGECLGNEMTIEIDADAVKNCYRLSAGDDLMTATIKSCNPNGSHYIWHCSDEEKKDMTQELADKLDAYKVDYKYYQNTYSPTLVSNVLNSYNSIVSKYASHKDGLSTIGTITGYPKIMETMWDAIDLQLFLQYEMMPSDKISDTNASEQVKLLTTSALSPVALTSMSYLTLSNTNNAVLNLAKLLVDRRYSVKIRKSSLNGTTWTGIFTVTNTSYLDDTADSENISVIINADYETYIKQKITKRLENNTYSGNISDLFNLPLDEFKAELKKYGKSSLETFNDSCSACIEILIEQGIDNNETWANTTPNMYEELYMPYLDKQSAIQAEMTLRDAEINTIKDMYNQLDIVKDGIQSALDFESYLGTKLWKDFSAYRREETYSNDNYISDGLTNAELFKNAYEFIQNAENAIEKASSYRHQISTNMKNLLVIKEFEPLKQYFEIGNWIRIKDDDRNLYKLRLLDYEIDFSDLNYITVNFSDAIKIVNKSTTIKDTIVKTSSIVKTYNSTIQNTLNKYESLNSQVENMQSSNAVNNKNISDSVGGKVDKDSVIGSINASGESTTISLDKINIAELFGKLFTVSDTDIAVGDALETNHIYIYYE